MKPPRARRVALYLLPGLGDAMVASPLMRALSARGDRVDAITMLPAVSEYARALNIFERVIEIPLLRPSARLAMPALRVAAGAYDVAVLPFPATRWQYAAASFLTPTARVVSHDYGGLSGALLRLRGATLVPLEGGHRIAENARLARVVAEPAAIGMYLVPQSWHAERGDAVAIHPGTMAYKGNEVRRWPMAQFTALALTLADEGVPVRFLIGPNEPEPDAAVVQHPRIDLIRLPLDAAARSIASSAAFVGNDAGMTHVAAGLGVPTVAIFGMTDPMRAAPIGPTIVVRPSSCPPCHDEGSVTFECVRDIGYRCIAQDVQLADVLAAVRRARTQNLPPLDPQERSDFALYGERRLAGVL